MKSGVILDERFADHHEQCGRNAFSRNVGNDECQMVSVHHKEIIKVATHLFGRIHRGIDIKLIPIRKGRKNTRQHRSLNFCRYVKLSSDSFFFGCDSFKLCDIFSYLMVHF